MADEENKIDGDPLFNMQPVFNIKNFDWANTISVVAVHYTTIAIGTLSGRVMVFNQQTLALIDDYQPHDKKITGIWLSHARSIISCSFDCKIFVKSLNKVEFDDKAIDVDQNALGELQCIDVLPN